MSTFSAIRLIDQTHPFPHLGGRLLLALLLGLLVRSLLLALRGLIVDDLLGVLLGGEELDGEADELTAGGLRNRTWRVCH